MISISSVFGRSLIDLDIIDMLTRRHRSELSDQDRITDYSMLYFIAPSLFP